MSFKNIAIWLFILAALGGYFYCFELKDSKEEKKIERNVEMEAISMLSPEQVKERRKEREERGKKLIKLLTFKKEEVEGLKVTRDGETIYCQKEDEGWAILEPIKARGNEETITGLISSLAGVVNIRMVNENPSSLDEYGLTEPHAVIAIEIKDDPSPRILLIGGNNPNSTSVYVKFKNSPPVFLVGSLIKFDLDMAFQRLIDKEQSPPETSRTSWQR